MNDKKKHVRNLAHRLGVPITTERHRGHHPHPWSGRALHVRNEEESELFHDLAHYQVSAPSRRNRYDFGGVHGEEALASLLGIAWENHYHGWKRAAITLDEHNWTGERISPWGFVCIAALLESQGYLKHGQPTTKLRGPREWLRTRKYTDLSF